MLRVEHISRQFGPVCALEDLSFEVKPGEVLGLVGANGAGKTTLLRCLSGILKPNKGRVFVSDFELDSQSEQAKRLIAYVPDSPQFFDTLTCWEHIRFVASLYQLGDFDKAARILLDAFGMSAREKSFPGELSHGMRQSLGLILAFMRNPKVFLLDEPITALDPNGIATFNRLIQEHAARGASIILSSHLLSILEHASTQVLILDHGRCRLYSSMADLRQRLGQTRALEETFFYLTGKS